MRNGVQLITYADRFGGGGLSTVNELLTGPLQGVFTGVHLLPFYFPYDGADAGFDPADHSLVDPRLGDWESVRRIAETHDVTADLIANHISDESPQFRDFMAKGDDSQFASMFLDPAAVFDDSPTEAQLAAIYRPRPGAPFTTKTLADGSQRRLCTTFTPHQIDLEVTDEQARRYLIEVLDLLAAAGVAQVRLDAIGYAIKTAGTSCFMTSETDEFIRELGAEARARSIESLLEIHSHHAGQIHASKLADRIYNFALPPLVLHALYTGVVTPLRDWLEAGPRNVVTVLDTHDGIGIIDAGPDGEHPGLLDPRQVDDLVHGIHEASDGQSVLATGAAASNLNLYQVNCSIYSALGCDDDRYLMARLLQFMAPGVPQVYYAGLLAAPNDMHLLEATGVGRDINRPHYSRAGVVAALEQPVVRRLLAMARFRNSHPAFGGDFNVSTASRSQLVLTRETEAASIRVRLDFADVSFELEATGNGQSRTMTHWDEF